MRRKSWTNLITVITLLAIFLTICLDLTPAVEAVNHYLVLHPCLFPTHMRVVFSVTKELVRVRRIQFHSGRQLTAAPTFSTFFREAIESQQFAMVQSRVSNFQVKIYDNLISTCLKSWSCFYMGRYWTPTWRVCDLHEQLRWKHTLCITRQSGSMDSSKGTHLGPGTTTRSPFSFPSELPI